MSDRVQLSQQNERVDRSFLDSMEIDIFKLLRRHWFLLFFCLVMGWVAAAVYFFNAAPTYESEAQLLIMPKDPSLAAKGLDGSKSEQSTLSDDLMATHLMVVQSPSLVKEALKKHRLEELPSLFQGRPPADYVLQKLSVTRGGTGKAKNAQVLKISMRHSNAEDAQKVVAAIVKQFQEFISKKYTDKNETAAELISTAKTQLQNDLINAESDFRKFREDAPLLWNGNQSTNIYRAEYEQLESALTDLRLERSELETRLKLVESQLKAIDENGGTELDRLALIDEKSAQRISIFLEIYGGKAESQLFQSQQPERLEAARSEYEGLLRLKAKERSLVAEFGPNHPDVRVIRDEIATVEEFLNSKSDKLKISSNEEQLTAKRLVDAYVSLMKHDLHALDAREVKMAEQSNAAEKEAKSLVQFELKGEAMKLAVDRQQELFDATVDRLRDINLAKDYGGFINELIAEPELGEEVWPKLSICGAIGTIMGLGLGGVLALFFELRNKSLRTPADVEKTSGVPMISMVPTLQRHRGTRYRREIAGRRSTVDPIIYALHAPQSKESEVFRGLRTSLFFRAAGMSAKAIAITSPSSGDGKSTVMTNLAFSIAQAGRRVLLIDADMRRPRLARLLGLKSQDGLAEVLRGSTIFENASFRHPELPDLTILCAGSCPSNPAELLASSRFSHLIDTAKDQFDFVLIDCPPVLAVADPLVVADVCDAVVVTLRVNSQSRVELRRTMELLADAKASVLGTIVNASLLESNEGGRADYGYGAYGSKNNAYFREEQFRETVPESKGVVKVEY